MPGERWPGHTVQHGARRPAERHVADLAPPVGEVVGEVVRGADRAQSVESGDLDDAGAVRRDVASEVGGLSSSRFGVVHRRAVLLSGQPVDDVSPGAVLDRHRDQLVLGKKDQAHVCRGRAADHDGVALRFRLMLRVDDPALGRERQLSGPRR